MKTVDEWSLEFDLMYNNITSGKAPGVEESEKSIFLTRAQEAIVIALYKGSFGDSFESTESVTSYLESLVKQANCTAVPNKDDTQPAPYKLSSTKSYVYKTPSDLLLRTLEFCTIDSECGDEPVDVVPVTQDEYLRTSRDPFRKQNKKRVLRLSYATNSGSEYNMKGYTELISDYPVTSYTVRYLSKPKPIILVNLAGYNLSIDGYTDAMPCMLPEALHQTILAEAVRMAKAIWNA